MKVVLNAVSAKEASSLVGLDLLRGFAALAVFFGHVRASCFVEFGALPPDQQGLLPRALFALTRTGHEAVLIFFVLSGYLVGGQIIRHVHDGRFSLASYALERCTRIFLPLIPACLLTFALGWFVLDDKPGLLQTFLNVAGLNGVLVQTLLDNAPLWSLAYEIWFYVLAGAIGYLFSTKSGLKSLAAFTGVACGVAVFSILDARLALYWATGAVSVLLPARGTLSSLALGGGLVILGTIDHQLAAPSRSFNNVVYLPPHVADAMIVIGVCFVILWVASSKAVRLLRVLRQPALFLSSVSYSLYLFHYPLNEALGRIFPRAETLSWSAIAMFCGKIVLLFAVINLLYLAFEARTSWLRRQLRSHFFVDGQKALV